MAHRIVTQVVMTGARVFGRAFAEAYRQAQASQKYAAAASKDPRSINFAASGLTLQEACKILNVSPPKGGEADMRLVTERFKKLFDLNDPKKGGSFYLQSKILRARERIELESTKTGSPSSSTSSSTASTSSNGAATPPPS